MNCGESVPSVVFHATHGIKAKLDDFRGQWVVLYFYPKDATPGCTLEGQAFRDLFTAFAAANAIIFGISRDSLTSHEKFKSKQQLPFELISDQDETLCRLFDVIKSKKMYGKTFLGIERSTFLIDPHGVIKQVWRGVNVKRHAQTVLAQITLNR